MVIFIFKEVEILNFKLWLYLFFDCSCVSSSCDLVNGYKLGVDLEGEVVIVMIY